MPQRPPRPTRLRALSPVALALLFGTAALLAGCQSSYETRWDRYQTRYAQADSLHVRTGSRTPQAPALRLQDAAVERSLARHAERRAREAELTQQVSSDVAAIPLERMIPHVERCFAGRARDLGESLIAQHPQLYTLQASRGVVEIDAVYDERAGAIELTLRRREGVEGDLAVAIPPGTYGVAFAHPDEGAPLPPVTPQDFGLTVDATPGTAGEGRSRGRFVKPEQERRFGQWPPAQDLALLRAPVLRLAADQQRATVSIPVACASFDVKAPADRRPFRLQAFERGSEIDRLMVELCALGTVDARSAQLAVWLGRDDVSWSKFLALGGHQGRLVTFGSHRAVLPQHGAAAADLLLNAGVDPRPLRFFRSPLQASDDARTLPSAPAIPSANEGEAAPAEEPSTPPAAPQPAPEPQLTPPAPELSSEVL